MKYIVWLFGDGSTQYTLVAPECRQWVTETVSGAEGEEDVSFERLETEEEQIARLVETRAPRLSPVKTDLTVRMEDERQSYEASLGEGAKAQFAGVISEGEYMALAQIREFREAWVGYPPKIDLVKCKEVAHGHRRRCRAEEFKPLDIEATIPALAAAAEAKRQEVRTKYEAMQATIDAAKNVDEIKATLP